MCPELLYLELNVTDENIIFHTTSMSVNARATYRLFVRVPILSIQFVRQTDPNAVILQF
jgi:hypothetical protein